MLGGAMAGPSTPGEHSDDRERAHGPLQQLPLNPQHFGTFLAVVDAGGRLSAAARQLGLSQPGVSHQLNELERRLGMELLDRGRGRPARVTRAGRVFERYARSIVGMQSALYADLDQLSHDVGGVLRFGASAGPGETWLPPLLCAFQEQYPNIRVELQVVNARTLVDHVLDGDVELAIVGGRWNVPELQFDPVWTESIVAVAAPTSAFAQRVDIPVEQLVASARFVLQEPGSGLRQSVAQELAQRDVPFERLEVFGEYGSHTSVLEAVAASDAVAWVWRANAEAAVQAGRVVELDIAEPLAAQHFLVRRASRRLSRRGAAFADAVRRVRERASLEGDLAERDA
jgi:DNA-binding transcriptional LysR family regulator